MPICHCGGSGVLQGLVRRFYKAVIQRCAAPKKCLRHDIIARFRFTRRHCEAGFSVGGRGTKCPSPQVGAGRYSGNNPNNPMLCYEVIQEKGSRNKCAMTNFGTFYQPHVIAEGEACPRSMDCFANARNDGSCHSEDGTLVRTDSGVTYFAFMFVNPDNAPRRLQNKKFEPYQKYLYTLSESAFKQGSFGCTNAGLRGYCTVWIQYNGWTIPENYPFKVK